MGLRVESTASQDAGTRLHTQGEEYFELDKYPAHKSLIMALSLPEVPRRELKPVIEEPRDYNIALTMAGVKVRGRIDLRTHPVNGHFFILDWKSCKNFTYCQTPETLARDPQGIIYLQYGFQIYPEAHTGDFRHIYLRTQEPFGAKAVVTDPLSRDQVQDVFGHLEKTVGEMKVLAAEKDPNQVPFDKTSCSKYGGCPYKNVCPAVERFNPLNMIKNDMSENQIPPPEMSSLAKKLAERRKPSGIINPPDAAPPYEVKPYDPTHAAIENMLLVGTSADPVKTFEISNGQAASIMVPEVKSDPETVQTPIKALAEDTNQVVPAKSKFVLCINAEPDDRDCKNVSTLVQEALYKYLETNPLSGTYVLNERSVASVVSSILSPLASQVFRGR